MIDEQYTSCPFYGIRRMTAQLKRIGYQVNPNRVARLMRKMGIRAIYPQPRTSLPNSEHRIYPYLLRGVELERVNQVWSCASTYIRLVGGFLYLSAVLAWHARFVLSWELSNTMEVGFCVAALDSALLKARPESFNTDQGSQFTSRAFTEKLAANSVQISMDGRGRAFDNILIERLWRSGKYEDVYLKDYRDGWQAREGIGNYLWFYNEKRLHSALGYRTPREVYFETSMEAKKK